MNIFKFLADNGIDTVDSSFYSKISEWESWYINNVRGFSTYRLYSGNGTSTLHKRRTLGLAKKVSEDMASLLLNENVEITTDNEVVNKYIKKVFEENEFSLKGNEYQERKSAVGTVAYVTYLHDMIVYPEEGGRTEGGRVGINYFTAKDIFPITWANGKITECAFRQWKTWNRRKFMILQLHHLQPLVTMDENGSFWPGAEEYVITNRIIEVKEGSEDGQELPQSEWKNYPPFASITPVIRTGSGYPQFVIDRLNVVNNASYDESNPLGVSIFANALDILKTIDIVYDSYGNEFQMGRRRLLASVELLEDVDGNPVFDPEDSLYYKIPESAGMGGESFSDKLQTIDFALRVEEHGKAINDNLNLLSFKCGFGTNRYRFESGQLKTATEVISENSDMYRTLVKNEKSLEVALKALIKSIIRLGITAGEKLEEDVEITIKFDDSIITDKQTEREDDRRDMANGIMRPEEYRAKWYGETLEEALQNLPQEADIDEEL